MIWSIATRKKLSKEVTRTVLASSWYDINVLNGISVYYVNQMKNGFYLLFLLTLSVYYNFNTLASSSFIQPLSKRGYTDNVVKKWK